MLDLTHTRACDTQEGGSCDCGVQDRLYALVELLENPSPSMIEVASQMDISDLENFLKSYGELAFEEAARKVQE